MIRVERVRRCLPFFSSNRGGIMKRLMLGSALLGSLIAGPAMAADMPLKAPPPPPVYIYSWTGCYVGGFGGGLPASKDYALTGSTPLALAIPVPDAFGGHNASSGIGGIQAGCNYQFAGGWVIGIQGDYGWTNASGSHAGDPGFGLNTVSSNTKSLASA